MIENVSVGDARSVSLRKSLLLLVMICVGPTLILIGFNAVENYHLYRSKTQSETIRLAEIFVSDVDRELAAIESGLQVLATSNALANGNLQQFHEIAKAAVKSQIVYNYILTDSNGHQVMNTLVPFGKDLPKKGTPIQLAKVFTSKRPVLTDYFVGPVTGKGAIALGVPVFNDKAEVQYSLNVGLAPEKLADLLKKRQIAEGWLAALIDSSGTIVGRTREDSKYIGTKAVPDLLSNISALRNATMDTVTKEGLRVSSAFATSEKWGWSIVVGAPKDTVEAQLQKSVIYATLTIALILLAAGWFGAKVIRHLTQSVESLNMAALELMQGKPIARPKVNLVEAEAIGQALVKASKLTSEVHFLAYHDALTNLANRSLFFEFLENCFARARRDGESFSLLALDLDHFKAVNDQDGHAAGDAILKEVAARIFDEIRAVDLAARIGGDEFVILLMNAGAEPAREVASRLCGSLSKPYVASKIAITASIGLVNWRPAIADSHALMDLADKALYSAKRIGRNTYFETGPE
jgi:diguanylate cyclase (GGDEF)-like protein